MEFKFWYIFDLYAPPFPLRFKKKKLYKSKIGFSLGIISILFFIYFFIDGIILILKRKNISVVEETKYTNHPKTNLSNIPFLFHLKHEITGEDYTFNTSLFNISLTKIVNKSGLVKTENIPLIKCNENQFLLDKYYDFYDFKLIESYLCPNFHQDFFLEGDYSIDSIVRFLNFKISVCKNNKKCIKLSELDDYLIDNIKLIFYIKINYPDFNNYKDPIKNYYKSFQIGLSDSQSKDFIYNFYQRNFSSDDGLIGLNVHKYSLFDYDSSESELLEFNDEYFLNIKFYSVKKYNDISRTYKKITEMLGEISGNCSFIFSICNLLNSYLLRNIMNEDIINLVVEKNDTIKTKKKTLIGYINNLKNRTINTSSINLNYNYLIKSNLGLTSKSEGLFLRRNLNNSYKESSEIKELFSKRINVKLGCQYHIFPLEFFSKSTQMNTFKKYKDFIFLSLSLEKLFEIDKINSILQKGILEINNNILQKENYFTDIESQNNNLSFSKQKDLNNMNQIKNISSNNLILEQNVINKK